MRVAAFAESLDHPRWLYVLANGDVLVAETNAPAKPDDNKGIKGWITGLMMGRAGAGVPSANRITLLRPAADGTIQTRSVFLEGLNSPFGMALIGNDLYVANTDALVRYPYQAGQTRVTDPGAKVVDLPGGPINHHWTKNVIASSDGQHLYVTVGSNSNVGDNGMEAEAGRAAIWEVDPRTGQHRIFASGLRNPVGLAWEPVTGALWTSVIRLLCRAGADAATAEEMLTPTSIAACAARPHQAMGGDGHAGGADDRRSAGGDAVGTRWLPLLMRAAPIVRRCTGRRGVRARATQGRRSRDSRAHEHQNARGRHNIGRNSSAHALKRLCGQSVVGERQHDRQAICRHARLSEQRVPASSKRPC